MEANFVNMGFKVEDIRLAMNTYGNNFDAILFFLSEKKKREEDDLMMKKVLEESIKTQFMPQPQQSTMGISNDDLELAKVIEMSMKDNAVDTDFGNPEQRQRKEGVPVGIKNVGNTCYFNSLLQAYFMLPRFVKEIMEFKDDSKEETKEVAGSKDRKKASIELIQNLKTLFAYLICSNRKYVDPSPVLKALVDDFGNPIAIGDQKDIGEFNIQFLSQINEALEKEKSDSPIPPRSPTLETLERHSSASVCIPKIERSQTMIMTASMPTLPPEFNNSFIYDNFFGCFQIITKAKEKDGTPVELTSDMSFGQIMINATEKDIYQGWDTNYYNEIEGFQTPSGYVTKAEQEYWITKVPSVLLLQLQRVAYDREKKALVKITNPVHFEKTIYLDRFLLENRTISSEIRRKVREYKKKSKILEQALEQYRHFGKQQLNILSVLKSSVELIQDQKEEMKIEPIDTSVKVYNPFSVGDLGFDSERLAQSSEVLNKFHQTLEKHIQEMEQQLEILKTKVEKKLQKYEDT